MVRVSRAQGLLQIGGAGNEDPFDSLPVKSFSGMNDLLLLYFETYPGPSPLTDDKLLRSKNETDRAVARRSNTQWHLIISCESSLLILLASLAGLRNQMSPCKKWLTDYLRLQQDLLRSIRERLPTRASAQKTPDAYVFAVSALAVSTAFFMDRPTALTHLRSARELIRLRGGIDTFHGLARRAVTWCEWVVCAFFGVRPTLTPPPPPAPRPAAPPPTVVAAVDGSSDPLIPHAFAALARAAHARTAAHLPRQQAGDESSTGVIDRVYEALTLVSMAGEEAWRRVFGGAGAAKGDVAALLDDVTYVVLVEVAELQDERRTDGDDDEDDGDGDGWWGRAVLLHAANAYLWGALSDLPPSTGRNLMFLERLRNALTRGGAVEEDTVGGGGDGVLGAVWRGSGDEPRMWTGSLDAEALMWVLAVGWFLAEKTQAPGKGDMIFWFEERILELLDVMRVNTKEEAAKMVKDFPGTAAFRRKWHWLLLQDKFHHWL